MDFSTRVYTLVYMAIKIIDFNQCICDKCGYEWMSLSVPATCASKKCRSPRWNSGLPKNPPTPVYEKNDAVPTEEEWSPTNVCKKIQDKFPQHIKDMHPEWSEKKNDLDVLKNLMSSIPARRESPIETPKIEQYDLSEPTVNYD